ncbi:MAG: translocation/assembly module TamB domain-containing protein [Syntrophobacteraceae bacterium]
MAAHGFRRFAPLLFLPILLAGWVAPALSAESENGVFGAYVVSKLSSALSSGPRYQVRVGKLSGWNPLDMRADRITVSDPQGTWAVAENVVFRMSGWNLLRFRLVIEETGAETITISRIPVKNGEEEPKEKKPFALPKSLPNVTVERFHVGKLVLEKDALGREGAFGLDGSYREAEDAPGWVAALRVAELGEGTGMVAGLELKLLGRPPEKLALDFAFHEPPDGWLATVMGLENTAGMDFSLRGEGPPDAWNGTLDGNVGRIGKVRSDVGLTLGERIGLTLEGRIAPEASMVPEDLHPLFGKEAPFALTLRLDPSQSFRVESFRLDGQGCSLLLAGEVGFESGKISGNWRFEVEDLAAMQAAARSPLGGSLTAEGEISGTAARPQGTAFVQICGLEEASFRAEEIRADLRLEPLKPREEKLSGFRISGTGSVEEPGKPAGRFFPERSVSWAFAAEYPFSGPVSLENLKIDGERTEATISGAYEPERQAGTLVGVLRVKDLGPYAAYLGRDLAGGSATVEARLSGSLGTRSAEGTIRGDIAGASGFPEPMRSLFEPKLSFALQGSLAGGARLSLSRIEAESAAFRFTGRGDADVSANTVRGFWQLAVQDLKSLRELPFRSVSGKLLSEGSIDGPLDAFSLKASLNSETLEIEGNRLRRVQAEFRGENLPDAPRGDFRLSVQRDGEELKASAGFAVRGREISLSSISFKSPGNSLTGNLDIDLSKPVVVGRIDGDFGRISSLGRITGGPLGGSGKFTARFDRGKRGQEVQLSLNGKNLSARSGEVGLLSAAATVSDLWREPAGKVNAEMKGFRTAGLHLDTVNFDASGNGRQADFSASARGSAGRRFNLQTRGAAFLGKNSGRVQIASLDGQVGEYPLKLLQPVTMERSDGRVALGGLSLAFGTGRIEASGSFAPRQVSFDGSFRELPLSAVADFGGPRIGGGASGTLRLQGSGARPSAKLDLRFTNLRLGGMEGEDFPSSTLTVNGTLEEGRFNGAFEMRDIVRQPVQGIFSAPVNFSVTPFSLSVPREGPVQGRLEASTDLKTLTTLLLQDKNAMTGLLNVDLVLGGTVGDPLLQGTATVRDGTFVNLQSGMELRDVSARLAARGERIEIESFEASDGGKGKVTASGWMSADPGREFPLRVSFNVSNAALLRRTEATATLSGEIGISGTLRHMATKGNLTVDAGEISIAKRMPANLPTLQVVEINRQAAEGKKGRKKPPPAVESGEAAGADVFELALDARVKVPGRLYVRGRGLNSEWKGELDATGTAGEPSIWGNMTVVRGTMNLFDQRFKVTEGIIQFYGGRPPSPFLNLTAEATARDVTVRVIVTGFAQDPKIELQSDPQLPSDEILSHVLFKRSMADLTPVQALKLARALNTLSGKGGGFDPMEKTRKFLGLDQLEIKDVDTMERKQGSGEKGTAVGIAKYLTDDIYVDVQKGIGDGAGKVSVEVEVTPNVTVEGNVGFGSTEKGQQGTGLGVNWKLDY